MNRDERFEAELLPQLRSLFGAAYRMTGNAHDAEDLVQETFLRAHRAFDRFRPGSNARAWLHTILHRVRTDMFRRTKRRPETVELTGEGPATPPPQDALSWKDAPLVTRSTYRVEARSVVLLGAGRAHPREAGAGR